MRADGYRAFNELLVANMRHAGALRIDHVMGLRRLFVIPDGASAADGAYVTYPMKDLLAQVALQSQRARCLVVGEDLGTVPEGMTEALTASQILSYSVLWFERRDGRLRRPAEWRRFAAACVSTHDLPTLAGWWDGVDIQEKRALSLLADAAAETSRTAEKAALIGTLREEGLLAGEVDLDSELTPRVAAAIHAFVSATPSLLALVQADDLAGELVAVNLPGTDTERAELAPAAGAGCLGAVREPACPCHSRCDAGAREPAGIGGRVDAPEASVAQDLGTPPFEPFPYRSTPRAIGMSSLCCVGIAQAAAIVRKRRYR